MKAYRERDVKAPPITWERADPEALRQFDPATKYCVMNCGPHKDDPRSSAERKLLCTDCHPGISKHCHPGISKHCHDSLRPGELTEGHDDISDVDGIVLDGAGDGGKIKK